MGFYQLREPSLIFKLNEFSETEYAYGINLKGVPIFCVLVVL